MCGIVGIFLKNRALEPKLGDWLRGMLIGMSDRGPDSTGFAIYGTTAAGDAAKLSLAHPDPDHDWAGLAERLGAAAWRQVADHIVAVFADGEAQARARLAAEAPDVRIVGAGRRMEIFKDVGTPTEVADKFGLATMAGSHGIGHTRMATESAVTTAGSHPFAAGNDICVVHNGSLSNHNRLRLWLERHGQPCETWNDTEVAARYFAYQLGTGASLDQAIERGFADLDGFYTFTIGTRDGFAVVRDGFACKPAVLAETDDWVAMASEFRSIADLPGAANANIWEPKPQRIYTWHLDPGPERQAA